MDDTGNTKIKFTLPSNRPLMGLMLNWIRDDLSPAIQNEFAIKLVNIPRCFWCGLLFIKWLLVLVKRKLH